MAKIILTLPSGGTLSKHNALQGLNENNYIHLTQLEKANLDNQSGINTGDETTSSIQTKRPLKTVDGKSLEGTGNIEIDYNTVINKPTEFPPSAHTHIISEVVNLENELNGKASTNALDYLQLNKEDKANKNIANGYVGLDSSGKINPLQLPALAITDTFVVNSQTQMLALVAEVGDVAVRTDLNKSFILRVTGASTLANWQELLTPVSVDQTIIDGSTNAVSGNAVFDGLALKAPISSVHNPVTIGNANGLSLSTQQLSLGLASSGVTGALSGTDWNDFNGKFNTPSGLTTNYLPKWNGSGFGNSSWQEIGGRLTNGSDNGEDKLQVNGSGIFSGEVKAEASFSTSDQSAYYFRGGTNPLDAAVYGSGVNKFVDIWINQAQKARFDGNGLTVNGNITASPAVSSNQVVVKSQLDAVASSGVTGVLSGTDWTTFNNKQNALAIVSDAEMQTGTENTKFTTALRIKNWFTWRLTQPFTFGNLAGTGNRVIQVNSSGDTSAPYNIQDGFTTDSDVITALTGATYNSGNNYTATITPANSKVFNQGQFYRNAGVIYFATADNQASRITLS